MINLRIIFSFVRIVFQIFSFAFLISCNQRSTLFESVSSSKTHITFSNKLEKKKLFNILYYLYYYNGGGVAIGDINNDGLQDIFFTGNMVHNRLYLNKGNFQFEDISEKAGFKEKKQWST